MEGYLQVQLSGDKKPGCTTAGIRVWSDSCSMLPAAYIKQFMLGYT